jgi:hypothetical protein
MRLKSVQRLTRGRLKVTNLKRQTKRGLEVHNVMRLTNQGFRGQECSLFMD